MAELDADTVGQTLDYLGQRQPLASQRLTSLPSASAGGGGTVTPPVTGSPGGVTGTATSPMGLAPETPGASPLAAARAALGLAAKAVGGASALSEFLTPTRGDVGGPGVPQTGAQSLSDQVRSMQAAGEPIVVAGQDLGSGAEALQEGGDLATGAGEVGGGAGGAGLDLGAGDLTSLIGPAFAALQGGNVGRASTQAALSLLLNATVGSVAGPLAGMAIMPAIDNLFGWDVAADQANRAPSVAHEIRTQAKDLPVILGQLEGGAVDPRTLAGMSDADLMTAFQRALTGYGATNALAPMFGESGRTEAGVRHLDMAALAEPLKALEATDFFNMVAAQDLLTQRGAKFPAEGMGGQPLDFGGAIHALAPLANLPTYGKAGLTAVAPWDPYYKGQATVTDSVWDQEAGGGGAYVDRPRAVDDPAAYLTAIGADPALAETLAPIIAGAQPGQYLPALNQMFAHLNPDLATSPFGTLYASQQGGADASAPSATTPAPEPTAPAARSAASPLPSLPGGPDDALGFATSLLAA